MTKMTKMTNSEDFVRIGKITEGVTENPYAAQMLQGALLILGNGVLKSSDEPLTPSQGFPYFVENIRYINDELIESDKLTTIQEDKEALKNVLIKIHPLLYKFINIESEQNFNDVIIDTDLTDLEDLLSRALGLFHLQIKHELNEIIVKENQEPIKQVLNNIVENNYIIRLICASIIVDNPNENPSLFIVTQLYKELKENGIEIDVNEEETMISILEKYTQTNIKQTIEKYKRFQKSQTNSY